MSNLKLKNIFAVREDYDVILLDIWGVIIEGNLIYPGIIEAVNELSRNIDVYFVSNSPRPVHILYNMLASWGIDTSIDKVFCSGEITRKLLTTIATPIIFHLGSDRNHDILFDTHYDITEDITKANILLLTLQRDEEENLTEFDELLKAAAKSKLISICANPDVIIPNEGKVKYGPGYFAKKIEQYGGSVVYTGKPYLPIYEAVLATAPTIAKNRVLMIGDTFETDILGAKNAGIHSALVLTGNSTKLHSQYKGLDDKLKAVTSKANGLKLTPNFVVQISHDNK